MRLRYPKAFTLIELLVVISIIALLIGILLPALGSARHAGRVIACATQQQQIGRALATYQADSDGYYPLLAAQVPGFGAVEFTWDDRLALGQYDGRDRSGLGPASGNVGGVPPFEVGAASTASNLYNCPLANGTGLDYRTSYDAATVRRAPRSYAMTRWTINPDGVTTNNINRGISGHNNARGGVFDLEAAISRRSEDVTRPSNTIALGDNLSVMVSGATPYAQTPLGGWNGASIWGNSHDPRFAAVGNIIGHHSNSKEDPTGTVQTEFEPNYMFADGHVVTQSNLVAFESRRRADGSAAGPTGSIWVNNNTQFDAEQN